MDRNDYHIVKIRFAICPYCLKMIDICNDCGNPFIENPKFVACGYDPTKYKQISKTHICEKCYHKMDVIKYKLNGEGKYECKCPSCIKEQALLKEQEFYKCIHCSKKTIIPDTPTKASKSGLCELCYFVFKNTNINFNLKSKKWKNDETGELK